MRADEWLNEAARVLVRKHKAITYQGRPEPAAESRLRNRRRRWFARRLEAPRLRQERRQPRTREWKVVKDRGARHGGTQAVRCITRDDADTSLYADVPLKPNTQLPPLRLGEGRTPSAARRASTITSAGRNGAASPTRKATGRKSKRLRQRQPHHGEHQLLHVGKGDSLLRRREALRSASASTGEEKAARRRSEARRADLLQAPRRRVRALPHAQRAGQHRRPARSTASPPAPTPEYIKESLLEPNKVLAKGFEHLGASPMPPLGLILKPQELADIQAFLQTLK